MAKNISRQAEELAVQLQKEYGNQWQFIISEIERQLNERVAYDSLRKLKVFRDMRAGKPEEEYKPEMLLKHLNKMSTLDDLYERTGVSKAQLLEFIDKLKVDGYEVCEANNKYWLSQMPTAAVTNEHTRDFGGEKKIQIAIMSDTHMCNKDQQITHLNDFYTRCHNDGISDIYHCGDISDGYYTNRQEQIYELFKHGVDEQSDYIIENYPYREGITTHFVIGNHDTTHIKNGGANIGRMIAAARPDMNYLGITEAKIWLTPKCDMDILHPDGGSSYAESYQLQKMIEAIQGGEKPAILCLGHYHKQLYDLYRNVHGFLIPCFEAQTPFMRRKKLKAVVGGLILTIHVLSNGEVREIEPRFIDYYFMKKNDY